MTITIEEIGRLPRVLSDRQVEFLTTARHSLITRQPIFVDGQGWVVVNIRQERDRSFQIRGVRVSDKPPQERLT